MNHSKIWKVASAFLWLLQCAAEAFLLYNVGSLSVLPGVYLAVLFVLLLLLACLTAFLFFYPHTHKKRRRLSGRARSVTAAVLSLLILFLSMSGSLAVTKFNQTMTAVTDGKEKKVTDVFGVYVRAKNKAETIADAKNYNFILSKSDNASELSDVVNNIEEELGGDIRTKKYDDNTDAILALYNKKKQALVLNEAYVDVLEESDAFSDFSEKTKILYEIRVVRQTEDASESSDKKDGESDGKVIPEAIANSPFCIYLSGSDTRSKMLTTSRSDVNILAFVNPITKQILLINTPRDYYIPNPAKNGEKDKLTHCGIYGIDCSIEALEELYGEKINYYAQINFTGFETLIDDIGGVTVHSDRAFEIGGGKKIQKGDNFLDGATALSFARERHHLPDGDNDRGQNQMKVLKAVVEKMSAGTLITNYSDILTSLKGMFLTDVTTEEIASLVKMQLTDMSSWNVTSYAVYGTGARAETASMPGYSLYVTYPDQKTVKHAVKMIGQLMDGKEVKE